MNPMFLVCISIVILIVLIFGILYYFENKAQKYQEELNREIENTVKRYNEKY